MRTGRVPGLDVDPSGRGRGRASCPFSRQSSFMGPVGDPSGSVQLADDTLAHSTHTEESLKGKAKDFPGDIRRVYAFQTSSSTRSDVMAATPERPIASSLPSPSSPVSPIKRAAPIQDFLVPVTSTPLKGTRKAPEQRSAPATPVKESESAALSDFIQFSEIPSFCLSTPEGLCGSSVALPTPVDASSVSRTMVASTLSGNGALKLAGFKSPMTSDTNVDSQATAEADTSISSLGSSLSSSPLKPWTKKVVGIVKGWLKPVHRRERRRGFDAN